MIEILFVGDGPRDKAIVPELVRRILSIELTQQFNAWPRLHGTASEHGYKRKLRYAIRQARERKVDGLVATVDRDRSANRARLAELQDARELDRRSSPPIPTALGEARPHLEAWLLDDLTAIREVLVIPSTEELPLNRKTNDPKAELDHLISNWCRPGDAPMTILVAIAQRVDVSRSQDPRSTGFEEFVGDVQSELAPLISN